MLIKRILFGVMLGTALLAGTAGTADAKSKGITITINKADQQTAKKVDAALKKGKKVILKVKGNKKTNRKLLTELQTEVGKYNVYNIRFDLGSSANSFDPNYSYEMLNYKKSGKYGKYTLSKSSCNAYKYCYQMTDRFFKKKFVTEYGKESYEDAAKADSLDFFTDKLLNLAQTEYSDADSFVICKYIAELRYNSIYPGYHNFHTIDDVKKQLIDEANMGCYNYNEHIVERVYELSQTLDVSVISYYDWLVHETNTSVADYITGRSTYIRQMFLGFLRRGNIPRMKYDLKSWGSSGSLDAGERMQQLLNGTARGVCSDFARIYSTLLSYFGIRSWCIQNSAEDHEVCVTSSLLAGRPGDEYGECDGIYVFSNGKLTSYEDETWFRLYKQAMGKYYVAYEYY